MAGETRWPTFTARAVHRGVRSSLSVGLPVHDGVVGALNIYSASADAFADDEIELATTFAGYAAGALANAHLYAEEEITILRSGGASMGADRP